MRCRVAPTAMNCAINCILQGTHSFLRSSTADANSASILYFRTCSSRHAAQSDMRMTFLRISLMAMCLATSNLLGQTLTWVDDSPRDSPITLKGKITFDPKNQDNITCSLTGHNNAQWMIVAYRIYIDVVRPDGNPIDYRHGVDRFFKDQAILAANSPQPRSDFTNEIDCELFGGSKSVTSSKPRQPTSKPCSCSLTTAQFGEMPRSLRM